MNVSIKFLGAARSVTGSKYLVEAGQNKILVDGGLFQGKKELRLRNWDKLPVDPATIDIILITHAHIDHVGYLPRLVKDGFAGTIVCTPATADLMRIMLMDAAKLQEEEALFAFKRGYSKHSKPMPLFTEEDAKRVLTLTREQPMDMEFSIFENINILFRNSGHILGSAIIEMTVSGDRETRKIVFSGDLGRYNDPIMYEPASIANADILLVESTYGDRHNPMGQVEEDLARIVNEAAEHEGAIIIPAFAVGRTQTLTYYLHRLMETKSIPPLPIFIDSPMAINVTDLYERHNKHHKIKVTNRGGQLLSIFDDENIHFCHTRESSKALNVMKKPCIIISASGMCTGGRIVHHLYHRLGRENDFLIFAGYQAEGTRGRKILDGEETVRIFGDEVPVKCQVRQVNGLSAHADKTELIKWLRNLKQPPKITFVTHGETEVATSFARTIENDFGWNAVVPDYLESFLLFDEI